MVTLRCDYAESKHSTETVMVKGAPGVLTEQRSEAAEPSQEIRKGINVLVTSDPAKPALNPFVQSSAGGANGGTSQTNSGGSGKSSESEK